MIIEVGVDRLNQVGNTGAPPRRIRLIVNNEMEINADRSAGIDKIEKPDKLLVPVPGHAIADHAAVEHVQGREQRGRAVALVIMRHGPAAALLDRQPWLCPVEGLDLAFLIHTQNQGFVGRIEVKTHDIREFLHEVLVAIELEGFDQMGLQAVVMPDPLNGDATDAIFSILGGGLFTLGFIVCALYLIARLIAVPLVDLSKAVAESSGGLCPIIPVLDRKDEIGGLTMAIFKNIIDRHHGDIHLTSAVGEGAVVSIWLPSTQDFQLAKG